MDKNESKARQAQKANSYRETVDVIRGYGPVKKMEKQVDTFSKEGCFLYEASLPPNTCVIKNGFLYTQDLDEEKGMEYVMRFKIINWDQIKERTK